MKPVSPLPWMIRRTGTSVAYYDALGNIVSFPENHEWLWSLAQKEQDILLAQTPLTETIDE
jgi:lysine/ornithine N-monooxygenase